MKDLHPDALRVLELAHEERTPSEADKARIEGKLALAVGAAALASGAVASTASSAAAQGALTGLAAKPAAAAMKLWLAGSALVLSVVTASYVLTREADDVKVERAPRVLEQAPALVPPVVEPEVVEPPALEPQAVAPAPLAPARAHKPKRDKATLATELELLHAAQAAWRSRDAREALALVKAHRARYPRSQLALERDAIQVLSLCELGRKDEASALGRALLARAPNSPLRASIEQSCIVR